MKKKLAPLLLVLTFLLTSCTGEEINENISGLEITELPPETTETFSETSFSESTENIPEGADDSEKTFSPESPAAPDTEATETPLNPYETSASETSPAETNLPISLYDSPSEPYDNVIPAQYTVLDKEGFTNYADDNRCARFPSDDKEAEKAALRAYKESDFYKETLEEVKEQELARYENGELVLADYRWKTVYGGFGKYIDESAAPELDLKAHVIDSTKAKFDGKTEESIFFLAVALPDSCLVSSGDRADFVVPVYVNSGGEAFILGCAGYQQAIEVIFIQYEETGKIHLVSNGAHSDATATTAVFSFENGQPKEEFFTHGAVIEMEENGRIFRWQKSYASSAFIFYSDELSRYCGIKAVPPTEEMAEALCSDKYLLENRPDIREWYEKGWLLILGGKYVVVFDYSYEYDGNSFVPTADCRHFIPVIYYGGSPFEDPFEEEYIFNVPIDGVP